MKNRKYDIYVLTVLLIIVAAGFLLRPQSKSNMIKITLNKEVYGYYDLNKNQTIHINKENTLKIENHKITKLQYTCREKNRQSFELLYKKSKQKKESKIRT